MQRIYNKIFLGAGMFLGLFAAGAAKAVCPVCVVAVGAGVGLCRWLGVDDAISGLWIGAVIMALVLWTIFRLKKKNKNFMYSAAAVSLLYYGLVIWPLYGMGIMGHPQNQVFGVDKLLFGMIIGTFVFILGHWLDVYFKTKNQGKVYFYYQKVIIPVVLLLVASFIFYFIIKCY